MAKTIMLILLATLGGVPVAHAEDSAEDDQASFTQYATINFAERREVHRYYANAAALEAAKAGRPLPQGSVLPRQGVFREARLNEQAHDGLRRLPRR